MSFIELTLAMLNPSNHAPTAFPLLNVARFRSLLTDMLQKGVIQESVSPWSSPVVLVKKKDGSWRICVDYRRLNKLTKKDVYPLPRIDDALDTLYGAENFSSIDLRSGYWQVPLDKKDQEKTAFVTPDGLYEFEIMPFGLCNATATFKRMMDSLLRGLKWTTCLYYLDDIIAFAPTFEVHLQRLEEVFVTMRGSNLRLNTKKCNICCRTLKILGHAVDCSGVRPDPDKIKAVAEFPTPRNIKAIQSFLGLCSYFRRFIKGFSDIAETLTKLL